MLRLLCLCLVLLIQGADGTSEEVLVVETTQDVQIVGSLILLVCLICAVAYCADGGVVPMIPLPAWVMTIQPDPAIDTGLMGCSDGLNIINPNCIHRHRRGNFETDGARWGAPLTKGKHLFEIYWPAATRGTLATVGVGTEDAPLFVKPRDSLVGCNKLSWGLDIARRRLMHNNQLLANIPKAGFVPDRFYMYVDCDSGTLGFGTEVSFWGSPINIPRSAFPVYAMIGTVCHNSQVSMIYRGSENRNNVYQGQVTAVMVPSFAPDGGQQVTVVNPNEVKY